MYAKPTDLPRSTPERGHRSAIAVFRVMRPGWAGAILTLLVTYITAPLASAVEIDGNGRISLTVGFLEDEGQLTPLDQLFYCSVMQACNTHLWQMTGGQHWLGEVTYVWDGGSQENSSCSDVVWQP